MYNIQTLIIFVLYFFVLNKFLLYSFMIFSCKYSKNIFTILTFFIFFLFIISSISNIKLKFHTINLLIFIYILIPYILQVIVFPQSEYLYKTILF